MASLLFAFPSSFLLAAIMLSPLVHVTNVGAAIESLNENERSIEMISAVIQVVS
jgi:hypothetical protein